MKIILRPRSISPLIRSREDYFELLEAYARKATTARICTYGISGHPMVRQFLERCPKGTCVLMGLPYLDPHDTIQRARELRRDFRHVFFRAEGTIHAKFVVFEFSTGAIVTVVGSHNLTGGQSEEVSVEIGQHGPEFIKLFDFWWALPSCWKIHASRKP